MPRIIGTYTGATPGPLVIVLGAMHGNEPAGVRAMEEVFQMLEKEPEVNPGFTFQGKLVGLMGNLTAFQRSQRFISQDFNRIWTPANAQRIQQTPVAQLDAEEAQFFEVIDVIQAEIVATGADRLILLDLHTTSADGGIFTIPADQGASLAVAKELHVPVILDLFESIEGAILRYAVDGHLRVGQQPLHTLGVAFEAGQHDDPMSVSRSISAVINCLRAVGCIRLQDVDNRHDALLRLYSANLPKVTHLRHVHHIQPEDAFRMRPGYVNFQPIQQGEHLADDINGPVRAPEAGMILMPLYQPKGSDGFFVVTS